jgi:hypothetical protein
MTHSRFLASLLLGLFPGFAIFPEEPRPFTLRDLKGTEHRPFADAKIKAVVLIFVLADCPIANSYAPEVKRLHEDYARRGVRFFVVQADPDLGPNETAEHARAHGYPCPVVHDKTHELVRRAGATKVPEAAVFASDGQRKYRGRIDDLYIAPGKRRSAPTSRDLRAALDALLTGKAVANSVTPVVGCPIPSR